jgi:hypothetical protein
MVDEIFLAGAADDHEGSARGELIAEAAERLGEREVVEDGDAGDDVVEAGGDSGRGIGDGEGHGDTGRGQLPRPADDFGIGVDPLHTTRAPYGEQPHQVTTPTTDIQRPPEPAGQLP